MKTIRPKTPKGFTLIELIVTVSIAGILAVVAIPSFTSSINSNRLTTHANELITSFNLARSEAVKRGQQVVVRKTGTNWENGWQVFVDIDRDTPSTDENTFNDDGDTTPCEATEDCLLRIYSALPGSQTMRGNNNFTNFIRYTPTGVSNNVGSFVICHGSSVSGAKLIIVNSVGRVRVAQDADHDGIPEKDGGAEITSCTDTTGF